jgi:hypothetical protein
MALNPRPLGSLVPGVPEGLARLVNRLIAKGPEDRPPTTSALREELRRIGQREPGAHEAHGAAGRSGPAARAPELIEREVPLRRLRARFDLACAGEGGAVIVSGDPGVGKTRLVEELRPHVEASGGLFLSTRANELERNLPFYAVREIIDAYVEAVRRVPRERRLTIIARIQAGLIGLPILVHDCDHRYSIIHAAPSSRATVRGRPAAGYCTLVSDAGEPPRDAASGLCTQLKTAGFTGCWVTAY